VGHGLEITRQLSTNHSEGQNQHFPTTHLGHFNWLTVCSALAQVHLIDFGDELPADSGRHDGRHVDVELSQSSSPESLTSRRTTSPRPATLAHSSTCSVSRPPVVAASSDELLLALDEPPSTPPPRSETAPQMMARSASASTTTLRDSRPGTYTDVAGAGQQWR